jgi:hypothetical protein
VGSYTVKGGELGESPLAAGGIQEAFPRFGAQQVEDPAIERVRMPDARTSVDLFIRIAQVLLISDVVDLDHGLIPF